MEEQKGRTATPPLQKGKSFLCYRDVNKAIERHRELFGLRLALKRAVKLENYCLTVDQMRDLNLRLKYGELDYHCFAATGRPGRPGNDERCPLLVRLKLSPDAQSLVVYESHNHEVMPSIEGTPKVYAPVRQKIDVLPFPEKTCLKNDITLTPINPVQKNPVLILPKPSTGAPEDPQHTVPANLACKSNNFIINNNGGFASLIPISQAATFPLASHISDVNSITITPSPTTVPNYPEVEKRDTNPTNFENHEKITVRIKKSQFDPSEMVVVGSVRDAEEQLKTKSFSGDEAPSVVNKSASSQPVSTPREILPKPSKSLSPVNKEGNSSTTTSVNLGNAPKTVNSNSNNQKSANFKVGTKPNPSAIPNSKTNGPSKSEVKGPHETIPTGNKANGAASTKSSSSPLPNSQGKSLPSQPQKQAVNKPKPANIPVKPTVLKQSADMKQVIIKKSPQTGSAKPQQQISSPNKNVQTGRKSPQIVSSKTSPANAKPGVVKSNNQSQHLGNKSANNSGQAKKVVTKPIQNSKITNSKLSGDQNTGVASEVGTRTGEKWKAKNNYPSNPSSDHAMGAKQNAGVTSSSYNSANNVNSSRLLNIPKKLKRKPGRPPESSLNNNSHPGSLDTELGFGEKQQLAHGVLLQLLRVTSQLPMIEFSHALDTLEILTDAFRLSQRVTLSISHDQEDLTHNDSYNDSLLDRHFKAEDNRESSLVSSTTSDDYYPALATAQVDGQFDVNELLKGLSSLNSSLPAMQDDEQHFEMMDVELPLQRVNVGGEDAGVSNESRRGLKRSSSDNNYALESERKRAKH